MKKILFVLMALSLVKAHATADTLRVLFVGNSYVQVNSLPNIIAQMAADRGDILLATDVSVGGSTLQNHASNPATLAAIAQKGWDYVVLQEQSQLPAFPDAQVIQDCYPYAQKLDSLVRAANPCAKTAFYMTWGRKNGDASNCASFPLICTYNGMDSLLRARYTIMAQANKALLSPVGVAWHKMRDTYPGVELYQADESHPSEAGSYLAAATFYTIFFRESPALLSYDFTLPAPDAANIRQVVKSTVWDSLAKWYAYNVPAPQPVAAFSYTLNGRVAQFSNSSMKARNYHWSFGDGNTDTAAAPAHAYATNGSYTVRLIARNCDARPDTAGKTIIIGSSDIQTPSPMSLQVFPNPASHELHVTTEKTPMSIQLTDLSGRVCKSMLAPGTNAITLGLSQLARGVYLLLVKHDDGTTVRARIVVKD